MMLPDMEYMVKDTKEVLIVQICVPLDNKKSRLAWIRRHANRNYRKNKSE